MAILRANPVPASNHSTSPPVSRPDSTVRRTARIVGVLFLAGFLAYGVGNLIATGIVRSADRNGSTALFVTGSAAIHANSVFYNVAEAGLGIGSLFFCALLFRTGLVPRFLAVWGFIGYACFAGGTLLELFGVAGAGLVGATPGGLFEVTFGIWLIARGFASTATAVRSRAST